MVCGILSAGLRPPLLHLFPIFQVLQLNHPDYHCFLEVVSKPQYLGYQGYSDHLLVGSEVVRSASMIFGSDVELAVPVSMLEYPMS